MSLPDFSFGAIMRSKKDPREIGVAVGLQEMLQEIYHVGYYEDRFMLQLPDDDVSIPCALDDYEVIRPGVLPFYRGPE